MQKKIVYLVIGFIAGGCTGHGTTPANTTISPRQKYGYMEKIMEWQRRENAPIGAVSVGTAGPFRDEYLTLLSDTSHISSPEELARRLKDLMNIMRARRYVRDTEGNDYWPTTAELFHPAKESDDCDGLELLVFNILTQRGYIAYRGIFGYGDDRDGHAATLLFSGNESDPFVIDSTGRGFGENTSTFIRLSEYERGGVTLLMFFDRHNICYYSEGETLCLQN